jgi:hypothetical protein
MSAPEFHHRPSPTPTARAWTVGHLAMTDRRSSCRAWARRCRNCPAGFRQAVSRATRAARRRKTSADVKQIVAVFDEHRNRLIAAVKAATPAQLEQRLEKPIAMAATVGEAL